MVAKYFVEVTAPTKQALINLQKLELDMFSPTAKTTDKNEFTIEGLVTSEDVDRLVKKGYKVLVKKESPTSTPAVSETASLSDWIAEADATPKDQKKESGSFSLSSTGYLTSEGIEAALQHIAKSYPSLTQLIVLPQKTHEGRTSRAIKIRVDNATPKTGLFFIGGVHAREIVNPDLLVNLASNICRAYTSKSGLAFPGKSYSAEEIKQIVESLDIYLFPLVNPDGRSFVQSPHGDIWWRKNRNPNPGLQHQGVDLNRNYDFLWDSGIGTSTNPQKEIYRGKQPSSEPETKNVLHVINTYKNITCVLDIHSYSELILYPWGDDENQSEDPDMNFRNPDYDGQRGHAGDTLYKEYIHKKDLDWYESTGQKIRNAIAAAVRGTVYNVEPGMKLYPTSGTCHDYVYSLRYNGANRAVMGFTIETGKRFQPEFSEATKIMPEVCAGLVESCLVHSSPVKP
jgi:carboxypeptidase T